MSERSERLVKIAQNVCDEYARKHSRVRLTVEDRKVPNRCPVSLSANVSDRATAPTGLEFIGEDQARYAKRLDRSHATINLYLSLSGTINGKEITADLSGESRDSDPTVAPFPTWYAWHYRELTDNARQHLSTVFRLIFNALVDEEGMDALWSAHLGLLRVHVDSVRAWADTMTAAIDEQVASR